MTKVKIKRSNGTYFNASDYQGIDMKIDGFKQYIVRVFGRDSCGLSHCWTVTGFKPYFYIKFEDNELVESKDIIKFYYDKIKETFREKDQVGDSGDDERLDSYLSYSERESIMSEEIISIKVAKKKIFRYFTNNKLFNFMKISFRTKRAMRQFSSLLKKFPIMNDRKIEVFESNIDPLIRFFHNKNIKPSGWLYSACLEPPKYSCSRCDIEKWVNYEYIEPIEIDSFAPFRITSFDIETYSADGSFPQPWRPTDEIFQIGITTNILGEKDTYDEVIITLGECDDLGEKTNVTNGKLIKCKTEAELLIAFQNEINRIDPEFLTGYNIYGFDWKYIVKRAELISGKDITQEKIYLNGVEFPKMSRINYETCRYVEKKLSSKAMGDNFFYYLDITGVVQIDLMVAIRNDFNLECYKLDYVSSYFLRGSIESYEKNKIKTDNIFGAFKNGQISLVDQFDNKVNNGYKYTVIDVSKDTIVLKEDITNDIIEHDKQCIVDGEFRGETSEVKAKYKWCMNKIDLSPKQMFINYKSNKSDLIREIAVYCIFDNKNCNTLMEYLDYIIKSIGMSNVCCVPMDYLFSRGQGAKIFSVVSKQCQIENFVMPLVDKTKFAFEGAIVLEPDTAIHLEPIVVLDYKSLYPSSMISDNISHDSLVKVEIIDNDGLITEEKGSGVEDKSLMELKDYTYN